MGAVMTCCPGGEQQRINWIPNTPMVRHVFIPSCLVMCLGVGASFTKQVGRYCLSFQSSVVPLNYLLLLSLSLKFQRSIWWECGGGHTAGP